MPIVTHIVDFRADGKKYDLGVMTISEADANPKKEVLGTFNVHVDFVGGKPIEATLTGVNRTKGYYHLVAMALEFVGEALRKELEHPTPSDSKLYPNFCTHLVQLEGASYSKACGEDAVEGTTYCKDHQKGNK